MLHHCSQPRPLDLDVAPLLTAKAVPYMHVHVHVAIGDYYNCMVNWLHVNFNKESVLNFFLHIHNNYV